MVVNNDRKLKGLRAEHQELKDKLERHKTRTREHERATERSALLSRNTPTLASLTEAAVQERESTTLRYAEGRLDEYINVGNVTLDSLRNQRNLLKSTQRRVLDAGAQLGISQSVMRVISRRTTQDKWIFYGCCSLLLFVFYWFVIRW